MKKNIFLSSFVAVSTAVVACGQPASDDGLPATGGTTSGTGGTASGTGPTGGVGVTGGTATGGSAQGGASTGGAVTGGTATGGSLTGGAGGVGGTPPTGGTSGAAGDAGAGGAPTGGAGAGGAVTGGSGGASGSAGSGGGAAGKGGSSSGGGGTGGSVNNTMGPCDVYAAATPATPCVGAYSTIRKLRAAYTGPLFQVRSGSNAMNTGTGGTTHDIMASASGFAEAATVDAACGTGTCTVSLLYDQSGRANHLPVAKRGLSNGGMYAAMDDFETVISATGKLMVGGHSVYSLYMAARQGYRLTREGDGVPLGRASQGLYMLADGTHYGTACCWDFGNVSPDPTRYGVMNTLFFGVAYWGRGAGSGPWMMADYEAGVWAGGTRPGDPGWGALDGDHPANPNNPSLRVKYALGFLKTDMNNWGLRMADAGTASTITTAYSGGLPKQMNNEGAIVIGVGGDNSNNSWGTFYEGAVLAGFPSDAAELAVLNNIKAVGYGR
jgi:non-reducing end alpha-L-arabinofuranosidase